MVNTVKQWYGRLGNNIQQISNALYYCMKNNINYYSPEHKLIKSFSVKFGQDRDISDRFFFYNTAQKDFDIDIEELNLHRKSICINYILPNFKFFIDEPFDEDILVIHLRSGDVFNNPSNTYVQNPLKYYLDIIKKYYFTIVVSEDLSHPLLPYIKKQKNVLLQSSSIENDFATLLRAKNLVSSGVGTFCPAAALCSINLKNYYCTNIFLEEHLNYKMLKNYDININLKNINNYINIGEWTSSRDQVNMMINYEVF